MKLKHYWKVLKSMMTLKCPKCRTEAMFINPNLLNINEIDKMHDRCPKCDQDLQIETGFYYGAMFVSYGITCLILLVMLGGALLVYGYISRPFLYASIAVILFSWLYIFRLSRVIWINIALFFDKEVFNF